MKHYFNPMSRAITTHWMLTELGVDHEQIIVDLMKGEGSTPEYRAINPMGKIPALVMVTLLLRRSLQFVHISLISFPKKVLRPRQAQMSEVNTTDTCLFRVLL